jgi:luciferase family oxidoreductase group 1
MKNLANTDLSVLDLAPVAEGQTIKDSFNSSLSVAQNAEKLGYKRFWMAEHHNLEGIASAATSVLLGYIAGGTKTIRIGSGGIMLPNHAPLVIAEQFGTLESLYPGRIDLGLGRAPGTDPMTMRALRKDLTNREVEFSEQVQELQYYLAPPQTGQRVRAIPGAGLDIPLWLLGSSLYSAQLAAVLGLPYAFAAHFAPEMMHQAIEIYRRGFQPSKTLKEPRVMIGVQVIAAETNAKAERLMTSIYMRFLGIIRNERMLLKPPVDNMDDYWSFQEKDMVLARLKSSVFGDPATVKHGLDQLIAQTQADELMIVSDAYSLEDRLRSFELIQKAKSLS